MTSTRLRYRRTTLHGGPLEGDTVRIYPCEHGDPNHEPPTITIALGTDWPHWKPTHWLDYHRHDDGTYHWTRP